jgi:hypothetical protein
MAHAQEATLSGTVTDTTGGALPGVTVRAVHEASGNSFEAVTDERGDYRIPARVGAYRVTAELPGFAPITRTVTLLVGQAAVVNLQLALSGVQESVTVTGEAPLLDVATSSLGGNIDPRQMQELPVQGRNWMELVMLAPGARVNAVTDAPSEAGGTGPSSGRKGTDFQLNLDGQQVTQQLNAASSRQPHFSKDAIAEFEFLSSRFDATQGRSTGLQVNAVTKSGTNTYSGTLAGNFRHDRFNAADHVANRVLPYQNQQISGTFGGPVRQDRAHFFGYFEYERTPNTRVWNTPYPRFNLDMSGVDDGKIGGGRFDAQFSPRNRVSFRGSKWVSTQLSGGGAITTPSSSGYAVKKSQQYLGTLTQILSSRAVNEVRGGYTDTFDENLKDLRNPLGQYRFHGPHVMLRGMTAGAQLRHPGLQFHDVWSVRDDFTYTFSKGGRHTLKAGAEYLKQGIDSQRCVRCDGELTANAGPIPANIEDLFPDLFDVSTWNLAPLSSISTRWRQEFGPVRQLVPRDSSAVWLQDDWTVTPRLTVNLGVRYDVELNAFANDVDLGPFLRGNRPNDLNNVDPRLGFTFSYNDRTVFRGGYGIFHGTILGAHYTQFYDDIIAIAVANDGRPDFAANPFNGPPPTYEELQSRLCTNGIVPGCVRPEAPTGGAVYGPEFQMPYAHQGSIGVQRQLSSVMALDVDYVYTGDRGQPRDVPVNVTYNPATGANYPFSDISRRPFPDWGIVSLTVNGQRGNRHALETALTKRFNNGWQASGTYTLAYSRDADPEPVHWDAAQGRLVPVPFPLAKDMGGEYGFAIGDQRHRAVFNGIWDAPYGFQISGLYFFGSGERRQTNYGVDLRQLGDVRPGENRLRPDGTIVSRNNFVGEPLHRVDLRLQRGFGLGGRVRLDGILEVFNAFNHANFGSYVTNESSASYGRPQQSSVVAYFPRTMQLGFRLVF